MTAELPPTNPALIADDSHWEGPAIPVEDSFGAALSNLRFHDARSIEVMKSVKYMSDQPLDSKPIYDSDTIAQPTYDPVRLIKVVQDTRWLKTPSPLTIATSKQHDKFEERANDIVQTGLYLGHRARTWVGRSALSMAQVTRQVYYLMYQEEDQYLFGLPSDRFADYDKDKLPTVEKLFSRGAVVRPPMIVGQVYQQGIARRGLTKIVSADILEPKVPPPRHGRLRPRPRLPRGDQGLNYDRNRWSTNRDCDRAKLKAL